MTAPDNTVPDWVTHAASLPLAFAQVREDPRLDSQLISSLPAGASVVMIASGGETAAWLASTGIRRLHLVDRNAAQLALTRLKLRLAGRFPTAEIMQVLGHMDLPTPKREQLLLSQLDELGLDPDVFGPIKWVATVGPDGAGRFEAVFARLRNVLAPHAESMAHLLQLSELSEQLRLTHHAAPLGAAIDDAFASVMSLPNLTRIFGEEATRNPATPFPRHFAQRTRDVLGRMAASANPFLWQVFAGRFPDNHPYDWLSAPARVRGRPTTELAFSQGMMGDVLESLAAGSCDFVHLSNILDWLSPQDASTTLRSAARVLRPGGLVVVRQLNSDIDIQSLPTGLQWDPGWGHQLLQRDRSFFYRAIHVARKP